MSILEINRRRIELIEGDITRQTVDAIVNAANSRLAGGGGVDGAIHRAAGPSIMAETRQRYPQGCPTGSAVVTFAGNLTAQFVIHAVGPIWSGGERGERELLASAYRQSLSLACELGCESIAFPALSAGAYRFPVPAASDIALETLTAYLAGLSGDDPLRLARCVLYSREVFSEFQRALESVRSANGGLPG